MAALVTTGCLVPAPMAGAGAAALPQSLTGHVITRIPTTQHVVALTFDAGSGANGLDSILSTLHRKHVTATFFVTGDFARANKDGVRRIAAAGHVLGTHTMTHPHLNQLSDADVRTEVLAGARTLRRITDVSPKPWFRFPFGEYTDRTLGIVNDLGYAAVGWTLDTLGWEGTAVTSAAGIVDRVRNGISPGTIVLMHVGANPNDQSTLDADALPHVIHAIRAANYHFTTVRALLPSTATAAG